MYGSAVVIEAVLFSRILLDGRDGTGPSPTMCHNGDDHSIREATMNGPGFGPGGIMKGAAMGGTAAGVLNVILYVVGGAAGAEYMMMPPGATELAPIPIAMPFILSLVPGLIGGGVLIDLTKVVPDKAWQVFVDNISVDRNTHKIRTKDIKSCGCNDKDNNTQD